MRDIPYKIRRYFPVISDAINQRHYCLTLEQRKDAKQELIYKLLTLDDSVLERVPYTIRIINNALIDMLRKIHRVESRVWSLNEIASYSAEEANEYIDVIEDRRPGIPLELLVIDHLTQSEPKDIRNALEMKRLGFEINEIAERYGWGYRCGQSKLLRLERRLAMAVAA